MKEVENQITDTLIERPVLFEHKGKQYQIWRVTLGKVQLLSRLYSELGINTEITATNALQALVNIVLNKEQVVRRIIAISTLKTAGQVMNEIVVQARCKEFADLSTADLAELLMIILQCDRYNAIIRETKIDKELENLNKASKVANRDSSSMTFGGRTMWGTLVDFACERYGWTMDYVLWGISFDNLRLLYADHVKTIYLNKDERKQVRFTEYDSVINADDPANVDKIRKLLEN